MAKMIPVVLLTQVQMDALTYLRGTARRDDVVRNEWAHGTVEGYAGVKLNVLQALMNKGLVVNHKRTEHYRLIQKIDAQLKPETSARSTKAPAEVAEKPARKPRATKAVVEAVVEAAKPARKPRAKKSDTVEQTAA